MRRQGTVAMKEGSKIKKLKRGRGRPAATDPSGDDLRDLVISAATEVYAEQGYGGTSVQKILAVSGVSRPTFYRLFKDRHEVIEAIVARANDDLSGMVSKSVLEAASMPELVNAAIDGYFAWADSIGPLIRPIYQEIHDPESPASTHRARILEELTAQFRSAMGALGRPQIDPLLLDALLRVIEHVGHQAFTSTGNRKNVLAHHRQVIYRVAVASLALPDEYEAIPPLPAIPKT